MNTGKTIALTRWTFVGQVMSLLFNMLSRLVINFLPKSKHLLISWLQSPSAVILEPQKMKSATVSHVFAMKWWDQMPWSSFFECWVLSQLFASLVVQRVKRLPAMQETWVWFLSQEDPLEKELATHFSNPAWRIPRTEKPGWVQSMGLQRDRHDLVN